MGIQALQFYNASAWEALWATPSPSWNWGPVPNIEPTSPTNGGVGGTRALAHSIYIIDIINYIDILWGTVDIPTIKKSISSIIVPFKISQKVNIFLSPGPINFMFAVGCTRIRNPRNSNWSTWMDSTQQIQGFQPFSQRPHPGEKSGGFTGKIHHQILGGACTLSFIYGIDTPALNQLVRLFGFRNGPSTGSPHEYPPYSKVASWMFLLKPQSIAGWWFLATPLKNMSQLGW